MPIARPVQHRRFVSAALVALALAAAAAGGAGGAAKAGTQKTPAGRPAVSPTAPGAGSSDDEIMSSLMGGGPTDALGFPAEMSAGGATGMSVPAQASPPAWYGAFEEAVRAAQVGKKAQATKLFRALVAKYPHLGTAWADLGLLDAESKQASATAAAVQDFKRAIAETREPHELIAYWAELTLMYARLGDKWPECEAAARKTLAISPPNSASLPFANAYLGVALLHEQKYAVALPVLQKRPRLTGEPAQSADLRLIFALEKTGAIGEALRTAKALAKQYPRVPAATDAIRNVGDFAVLNNRYDLALDAYRTAYALHPDDQRVGFNIVAASVRIGQNGIAMRTLQEMLAKAPNDPKVNFEIGLLLSTGTVDPARLKEGEARLKIAATRDPLNATYITQLGLAVLLQGPTRVNEGVNLLRGALRLSPNLPTAHLYLGYGYEQQAETDKAKRFQHFDDAVGQYKAVVALGRRDDSDMRARNRMAGILYTVGEKDTAYHEWQQLSDLYPNGYGVEVLSETASRLYSDERYTQAQEDYTRLIGLRPGDPLAYVSLGKTKEQLKDQAGAQAQYEKALQIEPSNATSALALGNLLKAQNKKIDAIAIYEKAIAAAEAQPLKNRDSADSIDQLNQLRLQLGGDYAGIDQKEKALDQFQKLTLRKSDPNRSIYLLTSSNFLLKEKRYAEAEATLIELAKENPGDDEVAYALSNAQSLNGHAPAALLTLQALATRYVNNPPLRARALLQIASVEVDANQLEAGAAQYEQVIRLDPQNTNALNGLSGARTKQGHPEAAGAFLEALALGGDKSPNLDLVRDLQQLYLIMDRTPDRLDAFAARIADKYPKDRSTQLYALSTLLGPTEATKPASRTAAQTIVDRLLQADAKDSQALYWRGDLREQQGKKPDAIADYTEAVKADFGNTPAATALKRLGAPVPVAPPKPAVAAATDPPVALPADPLTVPIPTGTAPTPATSPTPPAPTPVIP